MVVFTTVRVIMWTEIKDPTPECKDKTVPAAQVMKLAKVDTYVSRVATGCDVGVHVAVRM